MSAGAVPEAGPRRPRLPWTALTAAAVLLLAISAVLWPPRERRPAEGVLLIVDPLAAGRGGATYEPLAAWLSQGMGRPLHPLVVPDLALLPQRTWGDVGLVLCPDRIALGLAGNGFVTLAAARREAPQNLRPRSVLVYRRAAGERPSPWLTAPERTILGDTLTLAGCGAACRDGRFPWRGSGGAGREAPAIGPDPFDHAPVLHALRLGCFDYAVVREWAVDRFFAAGLLDPEQWGVAPLTVPLPDVVVLASRRWTAGDRVRAGELLIGLGRPREAPPGARELAALRGLDRIGLNGFNLLLEPDFELVRRQFARGWPEDDR